MQSEIEKTEKELENTIKEFTTAKRTEACTATEPLEDKKEKLEKKLTDLNAGMQELIRNTQNPRKVKRFLKDVRRMTEGLKGLERSSAEFQKADWFGMILDLLLVKIFCQSCMKKSEKSRALKNLKKFIKAIRQRFFWDCVCDSTRSLFSGMKKGQLC